MAVADTTAALANRANALLRELGLVSARREIKEAQLNARVQAVKDKYGPGVEELKQRQQELQAELSALVVPNFALLAAKGTKTIKLRSGEISIRLGNPALEVSDPEPVVIDRIRKAGGLRRFTRLGKRTLNKDALKKTPEFVAKIKGLAIKQASHLVIKPSKSQGEIVLTEDINPILPEED